MRLFEHEIPPLEGADKDLGQEAGLHIGAGFVQVNDETKQKHILANF